MIGIYSTIKGVFARDLEKFIEGVTSESILICNTKKLYDSVFLKQLKLLILEIEPASDHYKMIADKVQKHILKFNPNLPIFIICQDVPNDLETSLNIEFFKKPLNEINFYQNLRTIINLDKLDKGMLNGEVNPFNVSLKEDSLNLNLSTPILQFNEHEIYLASNGAPPIKSRVELISPIFKSFDKESMKVQINSINRLTKRILKTFPHLDAVKYPFVLSCIFVHQSFEDKIKIRKWIYNNF